MKRFASPGQAQRFLFAFSRIPAALSAPSSSDQCTPMATEMTASFAVSDKLPPQRHERPSKPLYLTTEQTNINCASR